MKLFERWFKKSGPDTISLAPQPACEQAVIEGDDHCDNLMGQGKKILVVDDNPVVLKAFEMKLSSLGFSVVKCLEANEAASIARDELPDVIVLDINFPPDIGSNGLQWNGFTVMQWLRRFSEAAGIPIIIISGESDETVKERAIANGASAFFQKPINNNEFLLALRRILARAKPKAAV